MAYVKVEFYKKYLPDNFKRVSKSVMKAYQATCLGSSSVPRVSGHLVQQSATTTTTPSIRRSVSQDVNLGTAIKPSDRGSRVPSIHQNRQQTILMTTGTRRKSAGGGGTAVTTATAASADRMTWSDWLPSTSTLPLSAHSPQPLVCDRCGRCTCSACMMPRPLPSFWLCDKQVGQIEL